MSAARQPVRVATAFTAPINATAPAERAAMSRRLWFPLCLVPTPPIPPNARITGSNTHGASIIGRVSDEITPIVVNTRGHSANASAPRIREPELPTPSASATRRRPQKPRISSSAHHSRCVTQPGSPMTSPMRKNSPCGNR